MLNPEMTELQQLIAKGESDSLDFKQRTTKPDRIARTLASFANTQGGIILVGIMNSGQISGIDPEEEKYVLEQAAGFYCDPPIKLHYKELEDEDGKTVLQVIIPESEEKPHLVKVHEDDWRSYVRVNDKSVQTSKIVNNGLHN